MNQVGVDISNEVFDATMQHGSGVVRKQFSNTKTGHRKHICHDALINCWPSRQQGNICMKAGTFSNSLFIFYVCFYHSNDGERWDEVLIPFQRSDPVKGERGRQGQVQNCASPSDVEANEQVVQKHLSDGLPSIQLTGEFIDSCCFLVRHKCAIFVLLKEKGLQITQASDKYGGDVSHRILNIRN